MSKRRERELGLALSYLCMKHNVVLVGVTADGELTEELKVRHAIKLLDDSLAWAKDVADQQDKANEWNQRVNGGES